MSESAAPPIKLFIGELHPEEGQKKNKCSVRFTFLSRHAHCIEVLHQNKYLAFRQQMSISAATRLVKASNLTGTPTPWLTLLLVLNQKPC